MKKVITLILFIGLVSVGYQKSHAEPKTEQEEKNAWSFGCKFPPPWDRNCNGVPDGEEDPLNFIVSQILSNIKT